MPGRYVFPLPTRCRSVRRNVRAPNHAQVILLARRVDLNCKVATRSAVGRPRVVHRQFVEMVRSRQVKNAMGARFNRPVRGSVLEVGRSSATVAVVTTHRAVQGPTNAPISPTHFALRDVTMSLASHQMLARDTSSHMAIDTVGYDVAHQWSSSMQRRWSNVCTQAQPTLGLAT